MQETMVNGRERSRRRRMAAGAAALLLAVVGASAAIAAPAPQAVLRARIDTAEDFSALVVSLSARDGMQDVLLWQPDPSDLTVQATATGYEVSLAVPLGLMMTSPAMKPVAWFLRVDARDAGEAVEVSMFRFELWAPGKSTPILLVDGYMPGGDIAGRVESVGLN